MVDKNEKYRKTNLTKLTNCIVIHAFIHSFMAIRRAHYVENVESEALEADEMLIPKRDKWADPIVT